MVASRTFFSKTFSFFFCWKESGFSIKYHFGDGRRTFVGTSIFLLKIGKHADVHSSDNQEHVLYRPFPKFNEIFLSLIKTFHEIKNVASQLPLLCIVRVFTGTVCLWEF